MRTIATTIAKKLGQNDNNFNKGDPSYSKGDHNILDDDQDDVEG